MKYIGNDCWNIIYNFKEQMEFIDHKKKFSATLKTIRDKTSCEPHNRISYKRVVLYGKKRFIFYSFEKTF